MYLHGYLMREHIRTKEHEANNAVLRLDSFVFACDLSHLFHVLSAMCIWECQVLKGQRKVLTWSNGPTCSIWVTSKLAVLWKISADWLCHCIAPWLLLGTVCERTHSECIPSTSHVVAWFYIAHNSYCWLCYNVYIMHCPGGMWVGAVWPWK